jgi:hypothetical protein
MIQACTGAGTVNSAQSLGGFGHDASRLRIEAAPSMADRNAQRETSKKFLDRRSILME